MNDFRGVYNENKTHCIFVIVVFVLCIVFAWLVHDHYRNEPNYHNTDNGMAELEKRMDNLESRLNSVSARIDKAQETVNGISATVTTGRENAAAVATGIDGIEKRIDDCIQRSGRIQNIIEDIENANRQGTKGSQKTGVAK